MAEHATAMVAAGGEVWFGEATTRRAVPPRRAARARQGQQRVVVIRGRNSRRVIRGAPGAASGELVALVRECSRQDEWAAFIETLGHLRPEVPKLLVGDTAPPHHPKRVAAAAEAARIRIAWLPFRSPELMPGEDLWCLTKAPVAANRPSRADHPGEVVQTLAQQAVSSLAALSPFDRLRCSGLLRSKFQWLST